MTPDHIFNCSSIIPNFLKIGVLHTTMDVYEDNIELAVMAVIEVHNHIQPFFLTVDTTKEKN